MTLVLNMLRCPDAVSPQSRSVGGGELSIGRGSETDWPLMDPDRVLSKKHCVLEFFNGGWQVRDTSTNGTFLNHDAEAIGRDRVRDLRDGDRVRFGSYELEVRIEAVADAWRPAPHAAPAGRGGPGAASFDDDRMFGSEPPDPYAVPSIGEGGFADPAFGSTDNMSPGHSISLGRSGMLPDDLDFGLDSPAAPPPAAQFDHAPPGEQSFSVPRPAAALLPDEDDWLSDLLPATPPPAAPTRPLRTPPMATSPFDEPGDLPAAPVPPPATRPAPAAVLPPPQPAAESSELLAAFLRGAGMEDAHPVDPLATMQALGEAFRAVVAGLRQALIARASIKGEFRIEQTMIRARGNNPLKFSAGDDDALAALLGTGRRVDLTPAAAIADALRDMRLHELATMAAMQSAVRSFLVRLDPAPIKADAEKAGGLLPAARRARAFDAFEKLHGDMTRALADDFDAVFGRAFARAYEQALAEASDKETSA